MLSPFTVYFRANYFAILNFALLQGGCLLKEEFAPGKQTSSSGVDPSLEGIIVRPGSWEVTEVDWLRNVMLDVLVLCCYQFRGSNYVPVSLICICYICYVLSCLYIFHVFFLFALLIWRK